MNIGVALFDDNKNIRESLSLLISQEKDMRICGCFSDCNNVLENIGFANPDVVLMDIDMPGRNGIDGAGMIHARHPALPVLMLTGFDDDEKVFASICAGASGYVLKNAQPAELVEYIRQVHAGGAPMTPSIAKKVLQMFAKQNKPSQKEEYNLSNREKDVLKLLVEGKSYKMIAAELFISYETVHSHIKKIYDKLHVNSVAEAVSKTIHKKIL